MTEQTMRERIARRLLAQREKVLAHDLGTTPIAWEDAPHHWKSELLDDADAALAELENPSVAIPIIAAAREWSTARQACLKGTVVTPEQYDRLARAEADLQRHVTDTTEA